MNNENQNSPRYPADANSTPEDSLVECLACGRLFARAMTSHPWFAHGLHKQEYIDRYKPPRGYRMASAELRERLSAHAKLRGAGLKRKRFTPEEQAANLAKRSERWKGRPLSERALAVAKANVASVLTPASRRRSEVARNPICKRCGAQFFTCPPEKRRPDGRRSLVGLRRTVCDSCHGKDSTPGLTCANCGRTYYRYGIKERESSRFCSATCYHAFRSSR